VGYISDNLIRGERVAYTTKLHWIIFGWPVVFLVCGIVAMANHSRVGGFLVSAGEFLIAIGIVWGLIKFIRYTGAEFGVTNRRVLISVRVIGQRSLEIMLPKVEGIGVSQDLFGRIFGYGSIVVIGTGGTKEEFHTIAAPQEFRKQVQEQIAAQEQRTVDR